MKYWHRFPVWNIWCLWPFQEGDGSRAFLRTICHQIWAMHGNYKVTQQLRTLFAGFCSNYFVITCGVSTHPFLPTCFHVFITDKYVRGFWDIWPSRTPDLIAWPSLSPDFTSIIPTKITRLKQWHGYESHLPHRITWPRSSPDLTHATKVTSSSKMATRITTPKQWHGYESHLPHRITWPPSSPRGLG